MLTLTVVKAVRVVGYATMDVAAQCRLGARKFEDERCTECSTEAMGLGLEALNAALSCAEVTEVTAAELSKEEATAEGYVGAAAPCMQVKALPFECCSPLSIRPNDLAAGLIRPVSSC